MNLFVDKNAAFVYYLNFLIQIHFSPKTFPQTQESMLHISQGTDAFGHSRFSGTKFPQLAEPAILLVRFVGRCCSCCRHQRRNACFAKDCQHVIGGLFKYSKKECSLL